MRRADRLFQIVQLLRGRSLIRAADLAEELGVSERTIYRDVRDLVACGVPIEGEAGVGYLLTRGFDLPPLMFTEEEIEVIVLGARMVESYGGDVFARRAHDVLSKVQAALPERLRPRLERVDLYAPGFHVGDDLTSNLEPLRAAIVGRKKVHLDYESRSGESTRRRVRPLGLYFWGYAWTLLGWCELRQDFRNFRPDRIRGLEILDETFVDEPGRDLESFLARMTERHGED